MLMMMSSCKKNADDIEQIDPVPEEKNEVDLVEVIDLGLSVKWASFNVGAGSPEKSGSYFSWGEIEEKTDYSWSTYKFGPDWEVLTKYCSKDGKTQLEPGDDVAQVRWGGGWRMPTLAEVQELIAKCTWTKATQQGVVGQLVTAPNGNSIFLPANGKYGEKSVGNAGKAGYYWTASIDPEAEDPSIACYLTFSDSKGVEIGADRNDGMAVRPVRAN